ncbi:MAG: phage terminase large subunit [Clostridia bacterium]|nr:phage terminase large subunit [Clostridia bacterium]
MKKEISVTAKQAEFINSDADETFFGGAAGGGKSCAQVIDALFFSVRYPGSRQLILRRTFPELERSIVPLTKRFFPKSAAKYISSKHLWQFKNGSAIELGYLESDGDTSRYQSAEYDVIRFDELTHFTESQYLYMLSRLRGANGYPKRVKSTGNPGGVGHEFVKRRFIDKGEYRKNGRKFKFIQSFVSDNDFLMRSDPNYLKRLSELPEKERRRLLEGDWSFFDGAYFSEFKTAVHVIKPFSVKNMTLFRSLDYGLDMTACLWWAVDKGGNMYIYRELYQSGLTLSDAARLIVEATPYDERIEYTVASPDLWNRRQESGVSGVEIMNGAGLTGLIAADNGRVRGLRLLRELLKHSEGAPPRLRFFEGCCRNLVRCLPLLTHSSRDPEDVSGTPHEITHAPEALRYGAMSRPTFFERKSEPSRERSFGDPFERKNEECTPTYEYLFE